MGRHADLVRATARRVKAAKLKADGAALDDARRREEGRNLEAAARQAEDRAKAPRDRSGR